MTLAPHDQAHADQADSEFGAQLDILTHMFRRLVEQGRSRDQVRCELTALIISTDTTDGNIFALLNRSALALLIAVAVDRLDGVNAAIGR